MLNLQISTVIIMTKKNYMGYMGSKSTKISTTLWRPMQFSDKNNQYMLKLYLG